MFLGTQRRFGVEIEFTGVNRDTVRQALRSNGIACEVQHYNHRTQPVWKIVTDSSCGFEMVSPILQGERGFQDLKVVLDTMTQVGCQVNRQTGIHVHLEATDLSLLDVKHILKRYSDNEQEIDSWFPRSRRGNNNSYCHSIDYYCNLNRLDLQLDGPVSEGARLTAKFCKVNTNHLNGYGTIEFRQHAGSTDYNKVSNWILFLQHFVEQSAKIKSSKSIKMEGRISKSKPFAFLRKTLVDLGYEVSYEGRVRANRVWTISKDDQTYIFSTDDMKHFYTSNLNQSGIEIDRPVLSNDWMQTINNEAIDATISASIPNSVVEFFQNRREELSA